MQYLDVKGKGPQYRKFWARVLEKKLLFRHVSAKSLVWSRWSKTNAAPQQPNGPETGTSGSRETPKSSKIAFGNSYSGLKRGLRAHHQHTAIQEFPQSLYRRLLLSSACCSMYSFRWVCAISSAFSVALQSADHQHAPSKEEITRVANFSASVVLLIPSA